MKNYKIVDENILSLETVLLAQSLIGKIYCHVINNTVVAGRIVETEAYLPKNDSANHASIGKTKRNKSLFLKHGHFYVYKIHQYYCLNIVAEPEEVPGCVLIRAVEPISGIEILSSNRNTNVWKSITNGPGKLCSAFAIDKSFDGMRINDNIYEAGIYEDGYYPNIVKRPRIGVTKNNEALLRFINPDSQCLSKS